MRALVSTLNNLAAGCISICKILTRYANEIFANLLYRVIKIRCNIINKLYIKALAYRTQFSAP
jgi:hypothetical protein